MDPPGDDVDAITLWCREIVVEPIGACCIDIPGATPDCVVTTECDCALPGGVYKADATTLRPTQRGPASGPTRPAVIRLVPRATDIGAGSRVTVDVYVEGADDVARAKTPRKCSLADARSTLVRAGEFCHFILNQVRCPVKMTR